MSSHPAIGSNAVPAIATIKIRAFDDSDGKAVCDLFARVTRSLAPSSMSAQFEEYITRAIDDELSRIRAYYTARDGGFWVADEQGTLVGMFGLERARDRSMELRRMYVEPRAHRRGIARLMLEFAESEAVARGADRIALSTSELQAAALALYETSGYVLVGEESASNQSHKTVGGGIRRFYFEKRLQGG